MTLAVNDLIKASGEMPLAPIRQISHGIFVEIGLEVIYECQGFFKFRVAYHFRLVPKGNGTGKDVLVAVLIFDGVDLVCR